MNTAFNATDLLSEGGPIMPLILAAAGLGYLLMFERLSVWALWHLRDRPFFRAADVAALFALLRVRRGKPPTTPLAWVLVQAVQLRREPPQVRENAVQARLLRRLPEVEARLQTIGWLGGILPMLGLLGTVSGMITTFQDLAETTSRQVLSQGLSEALWTTEVALLGALPLLATHHLLTRLKSRWLDQLERLLSLIFAASPHTSPTQSPRRRHEV